MTRKPRKWNIPLTYEPKIEAVRSGKCRQTIRIGNTYIVDDELALFGWSGVPRHSKWAWRTEYFTLNEVIDIAIYPEGLSFPWPYGVGLYNWSEKYCDNIAKLDHIDPPTGIELGNVLKSLNKIPPEGIKAQILRW